MKVQSERMRDIPLECAFQGSKVFEHGGPFTDLYTLEPREAKRDPRLKESGRLTGFEFDGFSFPLEPKTVFHDWLYISSLYQWREWGQKLYAYAGFTDIEFNPHRSINCQARSCALFLTLMKINVLEEAARSPSDFIRTISGVTPPLVKYCTPRAKRRDLTVPVSGKLYPASLIVLFQSLVVSQQNAGCCFM